MLIWENRPDYFLQSKCNGYVKIVFQKKEIIRKCSILFINGKIKKIKQIKNSQADVGV